VLRRYRLLADIYEAAINPGVQTGKKDAFEPPIREIDQFPVLGGSVRK
jgi:hypothetical protein